MSQLEVIDTVTKNDQTEVLLPYTPETIEDILDTQATVVMKSIYKASYEYVLAPEDFSEAIAITFCETDDTEEIQTEYNLEDFVADDEEPETRNTLVFSQADGDLLTQLFSQYTVEQ